jgi:putative ABC transport system substrate-binding protein
MRRRELLLLVGGIMTTGQAVRAQRKAMPVIGLLSATDIAGPAAPYVAAIRQGLSEIGFVEGHNVAIEYRWAEGQYDRLPALAADLVGRGVDVIAIIGGRAAVAAKGATSTIPIVSTFGRDPAETGLVATLARPGGNLTGFTNFAVELTAKKLELLSELVPQAAVVALLVNPNNPISEGIIRDAQEAARAKGGAAPCPQSEQRKRN